jgi:TM2 domain-containing membrane protein YozV
MHQETTTIPFNLIVHEETLYDFGNPKMLFPTIYFCLWLILSMIFYAYHFAKNKADFNNIRTSARLLFFAIFAPFMLQGIVSATVNFFAPIHTIYGVHSGPIPVLLSWIAGMIGMGIGIFLNKQEKNKRKNHPLYIEQENRHIRVASRIKAIVFNLIFPGIGQCYHGQFITGYLLFFSMIISAIFCAVTKDIAPYLVLLFLYLLSLFLTIFRFKKMSKKCPGNEIS